MRKDYAIDIYLPGNPGTDIACTIESDLPFLPFQKGDLINPRTWTSHYCELLNSYHASEHGTLLRVTGVEHFIHQGETGFRQHRIGIFTESVDDVAEARP